MAQHPGPKPQSLARRIVAALRNQPFAPQAQPAARMPDLETWKMPHRAVDVKDWEVALNMANNVLRPDRTRLLDLYDSILVDNHTSSAMESRVLRVVRSKYKLVGADGKLQPEKNKLLETQWFEDFLQWVAEAAFRGHTLIELSELAKPGQLKRITRIDARNVLPWTGVVVRRRGEETGYQYREEPLANYLIEVGQPFDLGILSQVAPVVITKKYAIGSWSDFVEKFGIPPRWAKTPSTDKKRLEQLETMLQNMVSSAYGIIQGTEEIQVMQTPGVDAHKVFDELISRMNSEISKRILGQDGTSDNKDASGTYGSLKVLQGVAEDRHQADKASVMYVINEELFPRLIKLGYPLAGVRFEWDELRDLSAMELVDAATKLGSVFEIDPEYMAERTGIKIIGIKRAPGEISDNGKGEGNPDEADNPTPTPEPATPSSVPIQETALNGAQVASLLQIITAVANGELPIDVARPLIRVAFPAVSDERISEKLNGMKDFTPAAPPDPPEPSGHKSGRQSGKKKGEDGTGDELDDEDEDGVSASWPSTVMSRCSVCGGSSTIVAQGATQLAGEVLEQLLVDVHGGATWSQPYFEAVRNVYADGLLGTWRHSIAQLSYDAPDHVARSAMEVNLSRFSAQKSKALTLELALIANETARSSSTFAAFKKAVEEKGILEEYNRKYLETEYSNAVMTGMQASRWYELQRSADAMPYGEYWTQGDANVRPVHAKMNGMKWLLSHPIWGTIWPPNGWGCRCTVLPVMDGPDEAGTAQQTREAMETLDLSGELSRMKKAGFDKNRAITGEVFNLNKAYRDQLGDLAGSKFKFGVKDAYGASAERMTSAAIEKRELPVIDSSIRNPLDAKRWFDRSSNIEGKTMVVLRDASGRPIRLERHVLERKLEKQPQRANLVDQLGDVLAKPDEVWLDQKGDLVHLRFTKEGVIRIPVAIDKQRGLRIKSFYIDAYDKDTDNQRQGLLLKRHQ